MQLGIIKGISTMEKYFMAAMGGAYGFGNKSIEAIIKFCGSAKAAWSADIDDLISAGIKRNYLEAFINFRGKHPSAPENIVKYCERHKINLCSINDDDYPPILKQIDNPPMFFYYRGKLQPNVERIGIVGTRENTPYGQSAALEISEQLAYSGFTIVSGAARGIDIFAHCGALKTGRTVAVLGQGIEASIYPAKKELLERIVEHDGVVISEFSPQLPPNQGTFIQRNRIIAGLCRGVIIVEAGKRSGAISTGNFAIDNNRDLFVIPGQIYAEKSKGCNELIRKGATLIRNARDVLVEYNLAEPEDEFSTDESTLTAESPLPTATKPVETIHLDGIAAKVFEVIPRDKFITDDEILMQLDDINPGELQGILLELDMKGCIEDNSGRYKRK